MNASRVTLAASAFLFGLGWVALEGEAMGPRENDATEALAAVAGVQVACASDPPAARPGDTVAFHMWVTDSAGMPLERPPTVQWTGPKGRIPGVDTAKLTIEEDMLGSQPATEIEVTVQLEEPLLGSGVCSAIVHIGRGPGHEATESGDAGSSVAQGTRGLEGRAFLSADEQEPVGYGLYTYLLFDVPPRTLEDHARYLQAIESYLLLLPTIGELERHRPAEELNVTLLPVKRGIPAVAQEAGEALENRAELVLAVYDYARARVLLTALGCTSGSGGPYLIGRGTRGAPSITRSILWDMGTVEPKLVGDWVRAYFQLASQERSWNQEVITRFSLNLRNVIAVAGAQLRKGTTSVLRVIDQG
jgi:hypothetical protein